MKKYWVYLHITPDGMVYVGYSGRKYYKSRWNRKSYNNSLQPYIDKYGWENISHKIVAKDLTKEEAIRLEGELINKYRELNICINKNNSGDFTGQKKAEQKRKYKEEHKEELKKRSEENFKKYREEHREDIREYKKEWDLENKDRIKEYSKEWYIKNKERLSKLNKERYQRNKEKIKEKYRRKKEVV